MKESKLFYNVINTGDGSVYVNFHADESSAKEEDESQEEGYAESSVSSLTLKVIDGNICFKSEVWDGKKHNVIWTKLGN